MRAGYVAELYQDFTKAVEWLGRKHSLSRVFNDLLTIAICSYHETNVISRCQEKDEANEALYFETIAAYDKEELSEFPKLMAMLMANTQRAPYSDLLGQFFTEHITMGHNGQFFTPISVAQLMTHMQGEAGRIKGKRVADFASGSGRLLLSFAEANPENTFYAADNAKACAQMSALNFFLNGMKGEVAWMNTLTLEWYGGWQVNRWPRLGIVPIEQEQSQLWQSPQMIEASQQMPKASEPNPLPPGDQLTLF